MWVRDNKYLIFYFIYNLKMISYDRDASFAYNLVPFWCGQGTKSHSKGRRHHHTGPVRVSSIPKLRTYSRFFLPSRYLKFFHLLLICSSCSCQLKSNRFLDITNKYINNAGQISVVYRSANLSRNLPHIDFQNHCFIAF